jgi:hypothetical protein
MGKSLTFFTVYCYKKHSLLLLLLIENLLSSLGEERAEENEP